MIRHGETEWSLSGAHTSTTHIPLTEHGRQRALELKETWHGKKFAAVLVSPRQRALETCRLAGYGDVAVIDEGLQEWNYGDAEGKTTAQMRALNGTAVECVDLAACGWRDSGAGWRARGWRDCEGAGCGFEPHP